MSSGDGGVVGGRWDDEVGRSEGYQVLRRDHEVEGRFLKAEG
jgi:hypothetical protein